MTTTHQNKTLPETSIQTTHTDTTFTAQLYRQVTWLGITAGLRSMMPIAMLTWSAPEASPRAKTLTSFLAIGELIGDKLPIIPSRLTPGPFIARLVIGAISGALLCRRYQHPLAEGAMRGALSAAIGTIAGSGYRTLTAQTTEVPDVVWASIEDCAAFGLGKRATQAPSKAK
ncbi:MAG TPA: hypothetical protein VL461_07735 [Dictyobacter sp.]|jgi:uncharacterized membrane protein|nr:hypothetical protein [Dictyobacter sp.]